MNKKEKENYILILFISVVLSCINYSFDLTFNNFTISFNLTSLIGYSLMVYVGIKLLNQTSSALKLLVVASLSIISLIVLPFVLSNLNSNELAQYLLSFDAANATSEEIKDLFTTILGYEKTILTSFIVSAVIDSLINLLALFFIYKICENICGISVSVKKMKKNYTKILIFTPILIVITFIIIINGFNVLRYYETTQLLSKNIVSILILSLVLLVIGITLLVFSIKYIIELSAISLSYFFPNPYNFLPIS